MGAPVMVQVQRGATLVLAGVLGGLAHSWVHGPLLLRPVAPLPPAAPSAPGAGEHPGRTPAPTAALGLEIDLAAAKGMFDQGTIFIDARRAEDYEAGHVEGALWIAPESFVGGIPEAVGFLDKQAPVVIYCTGGNCDASHSVATLLNQLGFTRCHIMTAGFDAWAAAGHATASGRGGGP